MLDLDIHRPVVAPREAATLLLVRDRDGELEVFCVVRHAKSGFLGGAVVFPGGKVDHTDRHAGWAAVARGAPRFVEGEDEAVARSFAVAACREALEEAAILPAVSEPLSHDETVALRATLGKDGTTTLLGELTRRHVTLDLSRLHAFARWVTPVVESRRFDTRFFLAAATEGQRGAHDAHETTASFWASPREVLRRFDAGELQVAPPTHRCFEVLSAAGSVAEAIARARTHCLDPVCPRLVKVPGAESRDDTVGLALPGDPEHEVREVRVPGLSRFVLREGRWVPERPPG